MEGEKKTETIIVPVGDADPDKVQKKVEEFCKTKGSDDIVLQWGVTPVMVGVSQFGGGAHANMQMITTCLIFWKCTSPQAISFRNQQKLLLQK